MPPVRLITPRQLADAIGVSESSLKRWSDAGKIDVTRTEGGHRRITVSEAVRFIRDTRAHVVRPDLLGLPIAEGREATLTDLLVKGDTRAVLASISASFLGGLPIAALCDGPLRAALTRIGELWRESPEGVMVEHRATSVCIDALAALRTLLPDPEPDAAVAVGGAPVGDPYLVPSMMCATALHDTGMRAVNLGPESPLEMIAQAARNEKAALVWVSVTSPIDSSVISVLEHFCADMARHNTLVVVGGRQRDVVNLPTAVRTAGTIGELVAIAGEMGLGRAAPRPAARSAARDEQATHVMMDG
jgi:MerR family transcriptional regulator, light-induced transcriptional regulator